MFIFVGKPHASMNSIFKQFRVAIWPLKPTNTKYMIFLKGNLAQAKKMSFKQWRVLYFKKEILCQ